MMYRTHLVFGILIGLVFLKSFDIPSPWLFMFVVMVGASLPDIDMHKSKVGGLTKPFSFLFNLFLGHRGIVHSMLMAFVMYFLFWVFFGLNYAAAIFIGYTSHLFLDAFTPKGISPFWPLRTKLNGIIKSGGILEIGLFFLFLVAVLLMLA
jgi:inner membrane protein